MTLLQISVLLLLVIVNGPGVDSTPDWVETNRFELLYETLYSLTTQSEIDNSELKERLSKIEEDQKEQKKLLQSVLGRFDQQDNYMEESRKERQCDVVRQLSGITYHADNDKLKNCPKNPYLEGSEWIVFQRRNSGRLSFNRSWKEYKNGFGTRDDELWLGLERLHHITSKGKYELRVVITYNGSTEYAQYSSFSIAGESDGYRLSFGPFVGGKAGDAMLPEYDGMKFSTPDRDNDLWNGHSCGDLYSSGWWFKNCHNANLNGLWGKQNTWHSAMWRTMTGENSASFTEMKIRRVV